MPCEVVTVSGSSGSGEQPGDGDGGGLSDRQKLLAVGGLTAFTFAVARSRMDKQ